MSRAFDYLSTGNTGTTFGNEEVPAVVDEAIEEQRKELAQLLPSVQNILDTIDGEIAAVCDIRSYRSELKAIKTLSVSERDKRIARTIESRDLFITMCERLKSNIVNKVSDVEREL